MFRTFIGMRKSRRYVVSAFNAVNSMKAYTFSRGCHLYALGVSR